MQFEIKRPCGLKDMNSITFERERERERERDRDVYVILCTPFLFYRYFF